MSENGDRPRSKRVVHSDPRSIASIVTASDSAAFHWNGTKVVCARSAVRGIVRQITKELDNLRSAHGPVATHLRVEDVAAWPVLKFEPRGALTINSVAWVDDEPSGSVATCNRWRIICLCHNQVGWVRYHRRRGEYGKDQTYAPKQCDVSCHDWTS
jgi:hypothetical protein